MVVLSEKLKGKTEFFCRNCNSHKSISALGRIITTPKKEDYTCNSCVLKCERNRRQPSIRKHLRIKSTKDLKTNVDKYIEGLNLKPIE